MIPRSKQLVGAQESPRGVIHPSTKPWCSVVTVQQLTCRSAHTVEVLVFYRHKYIISTSMVRRGGGPT